MNKKIKEKIMESLTSVLPITAIVLLLSITIAPMPTGIIVMFFAGACLLVVGMGFFSLGADMAMLPMGERMGTQMTRTKKIGIVVLVFFLMGMIITIAEPDLQVLAGQVAAVPNMVLIMTVAVGVGIFLVIAMLRILFQIPLSKMLVGFYILVIVLSFFTPSEFVAVAFDSGGVTTGPITVPFIMALGIGIAAARGDKSSQDDSFGLVALCSIGPILAVQILGILYNPTEASYSGVAIPDVDTTQDIAREFASGIPDYLEEVLVAVLPILAFFIVFQIIYRLFSKKQLVKMSVGVVYTYIGLVLFLAGANIGFMPAGYYIGTTIASSSYNWLLIPIGMVIGYFIVAAEPAVHVLNKQVEEISDGAISQNAMQRSLSIGVAIAVGLSMLRVLTGISIYWLIIPGYTLAIGLSFKSPKIFTGIAFDSGGVASGPMTATFLLPLAMGACGSVGGNIMTDAFGVVAMVAMVPLITIQMLGLVSERKAKIEAVSAGSAEDVMDDDIIEYEETDNE